MSRQTEDELLNRLPLQALRRGQDSASQTLSFLSRQNQDIWLNLLPLSTQAPSTNFFFQGSVVQVPRNEEWEVLELFTSDNAGIDINDLVGWWLILNDEMLGNPSNLPNNAMQISPNIVGTKVTASGQTASIWWRFPTMSNLVSNPQAPVVVLRSARQPASALNAGRQLALNTQTTATAGTRSFVAWGHVVRRRIVNQ